MTTPAGFGFSEPEPPRTLTVEEPPPLTAALTETMLVVTIAEVASRLGKTEDELTAKQRTAVINAIIDAQAAVEAEIHRAVFPVEQQFLRVSPYAFAPGGITDPRSWPVLRDIYDDMVITSSLAYADGTFDLTVQVGIDGRQEEPIRAFVRAHAVEALRLDPSVNLGQLAVTSVSAEGQSISYEKRSVQEGASGALPTIRSLRGYKRQSAYQARSRVGSPWPYIGGR